MHTITSAAEAIRAGKLSPVELLEQCLARIDALEGRVRAWVFVDRDGARAEAERLTRELKQGNYRGPLHGIPVGVKDIFDVFDWPTAAGSKLWANSIARRDATVVGRLRQAGAVLLGKTVTTAYASFDPPPTRNPWDLSRTPGGSSSGSAAAVACGMCLGALASQTGGSITRPASFCGVPGIKPTYGRVSVDGVMPLAASMDHVGVIAGSVRDLGLMLEAIAGHDSRDPGSSGRPVPDLTYALPPLPDPLRLGWLQGMFAEMADPVSRSLLAEFRRKWPGARSITATDAGSIPADEVQIREVAPPPGFQAVILRHRTVMAVEAAVFHEPRLRKHPEDYPPNIRKLLDEGLATPAPEYARCKEHQRALREQFVRLFDEFDALVTPATAGPAPDVTTTGDPVFNSPWSYTGLPTVSVPMGWTPEGLPLSMQLVGPPWGEAQLLAIAGWCERMIGFERREVRA